VSGYIGGHVAHPTYKQVCSGDTGHAEAVMVTFDPALISLRDVLCVFFASHDPTTLNRQGHDIGTQYRSGIYYQDAEQKTVAEQFIAELMAARVLPDRVVTEVTAAGIFYPAEDYHQDYYVNNLRQPYCELVVAPKIAHVRAEFARLVRTDGG
jgi:peptide-methionine (S)-S-oxide reductase